MHQNEQSFDLDAISWVRAAAYLAYDPRIILPIGALDQHGPHLPLGTNVLIARRIALDLSRRFSVLRAPTFYYGTNAPAADGFAGTADINNKTLHRALNDLISNWEEHGASELIFITAHRYEPHIEAIATLFPRRAQIRVAQVWDTPVSDLLTAQDEPLHADEAETSVMLFLYPELVQMDQALGIDLSPRLFRRYLDGRLKKGLGAGSFGRPGAATPEKGALIYRRIVETIARVILIERDSSESDSL